jgi:hypothetical protein
VHDVLVLSLVDGGECGTRVPVLHCADALREAGARVETFVAGSDHEIDEVISRLDGPPRPDGLVFPDDDAKTRLVVAVASDGQLRHVIRRMVRRYAPPPSKRPDDIATNRTIPDLPAIAVLPLADTSLVASLGLPRTPAEVASAVLGGHTRRLDLLRHDGGSVTLDGVLLGGTNDQGTPIAWRGRIEVDDAVLSQGDDPIVALSVANASGTSTLDGLPLHVDPRPDDGLINVAVAVPVTHKPFLGKPRMRYEVRRASGRAVAVTPHEAELPFLDDGVAGKLTRKRSWWIEPGAWSVYTAWREEEQ